MGRTPGAAASRRTAWTTVGRRMGPVKIVARFADGRLLKGYTADFAPDRSRFHLRPAAPRPARPIEILVPELKAVFFVRDFAGNPRYEERKQLDPEARLPGRPVTVVFRDGEALVGTTLSYDPRASGFFLYPADSQSNNLRVFVNAAAVRQVAVAAEAGAPDPNALARATSPERPTGGPTMNGAPATGVDTQTAITTLRETMAAWDTLLRATETLTQEHAQLRARCEQIEREHASCRTEQERLHRAHREAVQALADLRAAHQTVSREHEVTAEALRDLRARHDAVGRERQAAALELETILRRLQVGAAA